MKALKWCLVLTVLFLSINPASLAGKDRMQHAARRQPATKAIPPAADLLSPHHGTAAALPFFDDFESGVGSWTSTGFFNLVQNAQNNQILNPDINPTLVILPDNGHLPAAYSGTGMWWFGEASTGTFIGSNFNTIEQSALNGGTSVTDTSGWLISPPIDLTGVSHAQLSFRSWWEIEGVDVDQYDMMYVEISTDDGNYFWPLGQGSINPLNDVDGESWKPYSSGGLGQKGVWLNQLFDLTPFTGNTAYIRFRFDTIDELYNGFRGWFIDDVRITADGIPGPVITAINPQISFPGELVHIEGSNFVNGATVLVGEQTATAIISTNNAVIETPYLFAGTYDVIITNPDGQADTVASGLTITDTYPPMIYDIYPDSVEYGTSASLMISGEGFTSGTTVDIGGYALEDIDIPDAYTINGNTPVTLPVGAHTLTVTNPDGQYDRLILGFHVYSTTDLKEVDAGRIPTGFSLKQNYPNPFNPETTIEFELPSSQIVRLAIYNTLGQEIQTLLNSQVPAGTHAVKFSGKDLQSGIYFYKLTAGNYTAIKKLVLMK